MLSFFSKKKEENKEEVNKEEVKEVKEEKPKEIESKPLGTASIKVMNKTKDMNNSNKDSSQNNTGEEIKNSQVDYITQQCIDIGLDIKNDVERSTKAFFNSKNNTKASAYTKFQTYLTTLEKREIQRIKDVTYIEFKDKEGQISTSLKNGFAQYLSKGASLDDKTKGILEFVFGDIRKFPSKAHRFWYYKVYLWENTGL